MGTPEDNTPLDEGRKCLAGRYAPLAERVASRWSRRYPRLGDDISSQAGYGIVKAAQSWRRTRPFGLHATITVNRYIRSLFRNATTRGRDPSRVAPLDFEPPAPGHDPAPAMDAAAALDALPARTRAVVELTVMHGLTREEAAGRLGLAPSTVQAHKYAGLAALRGRHRA